MAGLQISGETRPDGDVAVTRTADFIVPPCPNCGGIVKPEVVFFGEFVPSAVFEQAAALVNRSEALVVAGSSLAVNTGMRLVSLAHRRKKPIVVINRGVTKADKVASVRIEAGASQTLEELVRRLSF